MIDKAAPALSSRNLLLHSQVGGEVPAMIVEPGVGGGPFPAVVFGGEAMGPNRFSRQTAEAVAALGFVTITPDYYRGSGPSRPDDYDDFTEVAAAIAQLDFRRATFDVLAGVDWARGQPHIDADRVVLWGYCTGATLAMFASALDRRIAATLLFFPSQPSFPEITEKRPVSARDLLWAIRSPVLLISGGDDPILPPDVIADLRARLKMAAIRHEVHVYKGAGHAFTGEARNLHHAEATRHSWSVANSFLADVLSMRAADQ